MKGFWLCQYKACWHRDGPMAVQQRGNKHDFPGQEMQGLRETFTPVGMKGRYLTFLLCFRLLPLMSLPSSFTNLHVVLKNSMPFCCFKILALFFSLLVYKYFECFRNSVSIISILGNIIPDDNNMFWKNTIITDILCV